MKQENKNVTIFMGGGGYEIAYIGKDIPTEVVTAVKAVISELNKEMQS